MPLNSNAECTSNEAIFSTHQGEGASSRREVILTHVGVNSRRLLGKTAEITGIAIVRHRGVVKLIVLELGDGLEKDDGRLPSGVAPGSVRNAIRTGAELLLVLMASSMWCIFTFHLSLSSASLRLSP